MAIKKGGGISTIQRLFFEKSGPKVPYFEGKKFEIA
jgi:hypothetical protein